MRLSFSARSGRSLFLGLVALASCGFSCKKGGDSIDPDDQPIIDLPGVDTTSLISTEKKQFSKIVHEYMSPCGDPVTLEVCVKEARACKKCIPAAKAVAMLVPKGEPEKVIKDWLSNRFEDKAVQSIDTSSSPSLGPSDAPLVVVEFADFQCPHCGAAMPIIHEVIDSPEMKPKVRFVFKEFPLSGHENAEPAARAALAAMNQGKFWEMHNLLFTNQNNLTGPELEAYARKLNLDVEKWKTDWAAPATKDRVTADRDVGTKIGVAGTPSIYVNGRKFETIGKADFAEQLRDWMRLEMQLMSTAAPAPPSSGSAAAPLPSGSTSAAPSASVSAAPSTSAAPSASAKGSK